MVRVVVVGSIHMDFYVKVPRIPRPGETVLGSGFIMSPGGKGANQAVGAARLGAETYMVGRVGKDWLGNALIDNFRANGVNSEYVMQDPSIHTGVAFILLEESGENAIAVAPGADSRVAKEDVDRALDIIKSSQILLLQLEIPVDTVVYAAKRAWEVGVRVVLNPAPAMRLPDEIFRYVSVLTPNRIELAMLTNTRIEEYSELVSAAKILLKKGVRYVVVTLGAQGALIVGHDYTELVPAYRVKVVDTTGAGDAFNAALAVFLAEGRDIREAVKLANAAAALKIMKLGAQSGLPRRDELESFIAMYK
ncbi:MAG: ribokinase [Thermoprotei archaeon]|nr:MAG: ribokinase [Thermoprotei archaeon]